MLAFGILTLTLVYLLVLFAMSMLIGQNFYIKAINQNNTQKIVLTFDDGPHPNHTLRILNILDMHDVKAVFFMVGKHVEAYPTIANEVAVRGHQIGIHSQNHPFNFGFLCGEKLRMEFKECSDVIENATGLKSNLFRPPFGVTNPSVAYEVKRQKLITIGWNVRSFDTITKKPDKILNRVMKKVDLGSIVLLHDRLDQTCEILPRIIEEIKGMGFAIGLLSTNKSNNE